MDKLKVKKYLRLASLIIFSMMIGSVITIFIKNDTVGITKNNKSHKLNSNLGAIEETYNSILNEYYQKVDSQTLIDGAIDGMLNSLGDQHTSYFTEKEKNDFDAELSGEYYGIGAQIQSISENEVKIIKIFDGSPAQKYGLQVGDVFVSIDGKSTDGMDATDISNNLRSEKATSATIVVNRNGKKVKVNIKKDKVTMFSVSSEVIKSGNKNIGYIGVSIFGQKTYTQFKNALTKLENQNIDSLIIDLRDNTGGYLTTVTQMLELFLDDGKILYQMQTNEGVVEYKSSKNNSRKYEIIILVNETSASASEIMAAAMKENYSAKLVGKTTYGKGTVQTIKYLSNNAMIKYTIEKWLTPSGNSIDGEGIKPDYEVEVGEEYLNDSTKENDKQLQKAIELLK